ncbi:hypothetical protein ON010_g8935 [Phytophthora cinnamomi]|nr:hypothetical protein ON010_g8935 [Phytophthora cinnamomi]
MSGPPRPQCGQQLPTLEVLGRALMPHPSDSSTNSLPGSPARIDDAETPASPPLQLGPSVTKLEAGRDLEEKAPVPINRNSPFKESVVINPRRDAALFQENTPDDFVLGIDGASEATTEATDLTGRDAGDNFRVEAPSENFWKESLSMRFPQQQKLAKAKKPTIPPAKAPSKKRRQRKISHPPSLRHATTESDRKADTSASYKKATGHSSKASPDEALDLPTPPFTTPGSRACSQKILEIRVPRPVDSDVAVGYPAEGIAAFADWESSAHPYQQFLAILPTDPCLFSAAELMPDERISIRADGLPLIVKLWRQFNGRAVGPT